MSYNELKNNTDVILCSPKEQNMIVDEPGVENIPSPHFFPDRYGHKPLYVIVHGTDCAGTAADIAHSFQGSRQSATHYEIGRDGRRAQSVQEKDGAWWNGGISGQPGKGGDGIHHDYSWSQVHKDGNGNPINPNLITISIECVN